MTCRICETRRPRRYCPGVRGEICSRCCGEEREKTVDCPLDCQYLQEARQHERRPMLSEDDFPNRDIPVSEEFLRSHEELLLWLSVRLMQATLETPGAADSDDRAALDSLIRTYRTLQSGLYYESRPEKPIAAAIFGRMQSGVEEYKKAVRERDGMQSVRDADILVVFAFLQRMELQQNNGRPRGRAFLDFLRTHFPQQTSSEAAQPLIR